MPTGREDGQWPDEGHTSAKSLRWLLVVLGLLIVAPALYYWLEPRWPGQAGEPSQSVAEPVAQTAAEPESVIRHPLPRRLPAPSLGTDAEQTDRQPNDDIPGKSLPALDDSDAMVRNGIIQAIAPLEIGDLLKPWHLIRNLVVTIDNMTGRQIPRKYLPIKAPNGRFTAIETEGRVILGPKNYIRYSSYVELFSGIDSKKIIAVYIDMYPLFQEAYRELGYPTRHFNDRLIDVIDNLLETPEIDDPIELIQPSVYYQFAEPELEALSSGQKLLLRMGVDNVILIKKKLREIRRELTGT